MKLVTTRLFSWWFLIVAASSHTQERVWIPLPGQEELPPPAIAVRQANQAEMAWYKDPTNEEAANNCKRYFVPGPRLNAVVSLIERAIRNGSRAVTADHSEKFVSVVVKAGTAVVETTETTTLVWSSGRSWQQKDNRHKYTLRLVDGQWKIEKDEFVQ